MLGNHKEKNCLFKSFFKKIGGSITMIQKNIKMSVAGSGTPEISPEEFKDQIKEWTLIDVRNPDEFVGELSHIPGAKLVTLGADLDAFLKTHNKNDKIVFVCRSGGRSGQATMKSRSLGFTNSFNLQGGMLLWNQKRLPVE